MIFILTILAVIGVVIVSRILNDENGKQVRPYFIAGIVVIYTLYLVINCIMNWLIDNSFIYIF